MQPEQVPAISVADLPTDAVLLDVREDDEWAAGHAPGATHVPLGALPARTGDVPAVDQLYVVCRMGGRSAQAVAYLRSLGIEALNVDGGMRAWAAAGRPVVSEDAQAPAVM